MNKSWEQVRDFHVKFEHPVSDNPVLIEKDRAQKRYSWMKEEIDEFLEATDIYEQADAMIDLIYFALGTMVEMGVKPQELFDIVHDANMSKLFPDGKPHYKPDGKTLKPEGWQDPHDKIAAVIDGHEV